MIFDPLQGRFKPVTRGSLVVPGVRELATKVGGMLLCTDQEDTVLEDGRCERGYGCLEIHQIHVIRPGCVTEIYTQTDEHVVVVRIGWPMLVEFDREIDVVRGVGGLGGVRAEENRESDRMLSEDQPGGGRDRERRR
jgi:hypothetical protein